MNHTTQPLSKERLRGAALAAINESTDVPYSHILLNEERWRAIAENEGISFIAGLPVRLMHHMDLRGLLDRSLGGKFSYFDHSAYLIPEAHYEQAKIVELDFEFEVTREIEEILRSGDTTVRPSEGDYQYWYTAEVLKGEAHDKLARLIAPTGSHGTWYLRNSINIQVRGSAITIVATSSSPRKEAEIIPWLLRLYKGIKIDTAELRKRSDRLLATAARLEERAQYFENLTLEQF